MSGDTEKREGFEKWLKQLVPMVQMEGYNALRRELLPVLEAAEGALSYRIDDVMRLRAELDKLKGKG